VKVSCPSLCLRQKAGSTGALKRLARMAAEDVAIALCPRKSISTPSDRNVDWSIRIPSTFPPLRALAILGKAPALSRNTPPNRALSRLTH
jgi:hypothetical protein